MRDTIQRDPGIAGSERHHPAAIRAVLGTLVAVLIGSGTTACEDTNHDNIDKWMRTEKGPGKLVSAFKDGNLGVELRAHAGQNLIRMDKNEPVLEHLEKMSAQSRQPLIAAMARRLWEDARIEGEFTMPQGPQVTAKDALFDIRRFAEGESRQLIDRYLIDWLGEGYYSARARVGRHSGTAVVATIGKAASEPLLRRVKSMLATSADDKGSQYKLEDPLLQGLAASGNPEAVEILLDLLDRQHNDKTLAKRAFTALYVGYVKNDGTFPLADPKALVPHLDRLVELAKDSGRSSRDINDAIRLIAATGPPTCIQPLVNLVAFPHEFEKFIWVAANSALQCGKANALVPIADALPRKRRYSQRELRGVLVEPILTLDDKNAVARQARTLLESKSWVARVIGVELLGSLKLPASAADDAVLLRKLAKDKTVLRGWWGDQSEVAKRDRKKAPRLGEYAEEVAARLDPIAKSG